MRANDRYRWAPRTPATNNIPLRGKLKLGIYSPAPKRVLPPYLGAFARQDVRQEPVEPIRPAESLVSPYTDINCKRWSIDYKPGEEREDRVQRCKPCVYPPKTDTLHFDYSKYEATVKYASEGVQNSNSLTEGNAQVELHGGNWSRDRVRSEGRSESGLSFGVPDDEKQQSFPRSSSGCNGKRASNEKIVTHVASRSREEKASCEKWKKEKASGEQSIISDAEKRTSKGSCAVERTFPELRALEKSLRSYELDEFIASPTRSRLISADSPVESELVDEPIPFSSMRFGRSKFVSGAESIRGMKLGGKWVSGGEKMPTQDAERTPTSRGLRKTHVDEDPNPNPAQKAERTPTARGLRITQYEDEEHIQNAERTPAFVDLLKTYVDEEVAQNADRIPTSRGLRMTQYEDEEHIQNAECTPAFVELLKTYVDEEVAQNADRIPTSRGLRMTQYEDEQHIQNEECTPAFVDLKTYVDEEVAQNADQILTSGGLHMTQYEDEEHIQNAECTPAFGDLKTYVDEEVAQNADRTPTSRGSDRFQSKSWETALAFAPHSRVPQQPTIRWGCEFPEMSTESGVQNSKSAKRQSNAHARSVHSDCSCSPVSASANEDLGLAVANPSEVSCVSQVDERHKIEPLSGRYVDTSPSRSPSGLRTSPSDRLHSAANTVEAVATIVARSAKRERKLHGRRPEAKNEHIAVPKPKISRVVKGIGASQGVVLLDSRKKSNLDHRRASAHRAKGESSILQTLAELEKRQDNLLELTHRMEHLARSTQCVESAQDEYLARMHANQQFMEAMCGIDGSHGAIQEFADEVTLIRGAFQSLLRIIPVQL